MNKLSVITVNLNDAAALKRTLSSVFDNQSFSDIEYIIMDCDSTDDSVGVIRSYGDKISHIQGVSSDGIYSAMNEGAKRARGEYLLFLKAGDRLANNVHKKVFAEPLDADIVFCDVVYPYEKNRVKTICFPDKISVLDILQNPPPLSSTFIKREVLSKNPFHEDFSLISDWAFLMEEFIYNNPTSRHMGIAMTHCTIKGKQYNGNCMTKSQGEKEAFFDKYHPELKDMIKMCKYIDTTDAISKHRSVELEESDWIQRCARQYMKLLLIIKKLFNIKG